MAAFNQTYKVCVRTTTATGKPGAVWRPSSYVFIPPFSDLLVIEDSNEGHQSDLNQSENGEIEPDMQGLFRDEVGKHENSAADKFTTGMILIVVLW